MAMDDALPIAEKFDAGIAKSRMLIDTLPAAGMPVHPKEDGEHRAWVDTGGISVGISLLFVRAVIN